MPFIQAKLFNPDAFSARQRIYAPSPVWSGSSRREVNYQPMSKRQAVELYHRAREFERTTRRPGRQDGTVTRNGLAVLQCLIFDYLNFRSGRLDPSHAGIARKAGISERSVRRGLVALRLAGVVDWVKRCVAEVIGGRFELRQQTNAYGISPVSLWRGFRVRPPAPTPSPGTWGDHPPLPSPVMMASAAAAEGGGIGAMIEALELDGSDSFALTLARLGRELKGRLS